MKNLIRLTLIAFLAFGYSACKKSTSMENPSAQQPTLIAHIYPNVNQPNDAVLGQPSAAFVVGDKVIVYVPYQINNDALNVSKLIIKDELNEIVDIKDLKTSADPVADGLNVPDEIQSQMFLYTVIELQDYYANRTISLSIDIQGFNASASDKIGNAFWVIP